MFLVRFLCFFFLSFQFCQSPGWMCCPLVECSGITTSNLACPAIFTFINHFRVSAY